MDHELAWGACAWGLEFFHPFEIAKFKSAAQQISALPFPTVPRTIEIISLMGEDHYHTQSLAAAPQLREAAAEYNLSIVVCDFTPNMLDPTQPGPHITSPHTFIRREAVARKKRSIDLASALARAGEQGVVSGPGLRRHGYLKPRTREEEDLFITTVREEIAPYARDKNVLVADEALNHHEGYLLRPGTHALEMITAIDSPFIGLNMDSVHYALSGADLMKEWHASLASGKVYAVHLSEPHREEWGTGGISVHTRGLIDALNRAKYTGSVCLENFCPDLHGAAGIHGPPTLIAHATPKSCAEILHDGAAYITKQMAEAA